jgi:hypothetical protein
LTGGGFVGSSVSAVRFMVAVKNPPLLMLISALKSPSSRQGCAPQPPQHPPLVLPLPRSRSLPLQIQLPRLQLFL